MTLKSKYKEKVELLISGYSSEYSNNNYIPTVISQVIEKLYYEKDKEPTLKLIVPNDYSFQIKCLLDTKGEWLLNIVKYKLNYKWYGNKFYNKKIETGTITNFCINNIDNNRHTACFAIKTVENYWFEGKYDCKLIGYNKDNQIQIELNETLQLKMKIFEEYNYGFN